MTRCNSLRLGIPYLIGASCIENGHIIVSRWTDTPEVLSIQGDILLSCKGTIGEIVLNTTGELHIARQFMAIRSKQRESILPEYIKLLILASVDNLKKRARGIIPGVTREDILDMPIILPPLREQLRILSRYKELDSLIVGMGLILREESV